MPRRGAYPGSFDPLTVAHVAIATAAFGACSLDSLDLVLSRQPLAKAEPSDLDTRAAAIERAGFRAVLTDAQLLADIAEGYDVLVLGADKWAQVRDPAFYGGSVDARDAAVAGLPHIAVVPRHGLSVPAGDHVTVLSGLGVDDVSSTAVRAGRTEWRAW